MAPNQANWLKRIGEYLYVNDHGIYFAWFSMRGKQIRCELGHQRLVEVEALHPQVGY